jgi:seryl-tRNA synthetase
MLDINVIRNDPDKVREAVEKKQEKADIDAILELDEKWRSLTHEAEQKQSVRNAVSKEIGEAKKEGKDAEEKMKKMKKLSSEIKEMEADCKTLQKERDELVMWVPNIPDDDVPVGRGEEDNTVVRECGEKKEFSFTPLPHWDLGENLDIIDFKGGAKLSGTGFYSLKGKGARLERALLNFMLDLHTSEHGYLEVYPPALVNRETMTGSGQIPKMEDQMYHCEVDDLFLVPTAEVPLTNLKGGEVIRGDELPICYTAFTPCFRREAGAAGKDTRGIIRVHQFSKVELLKFVKPETSEQELENLTADAEKVLQLLGLPYRVIVLCTGDTSFAAAKTYDIELWAPGAERWLEVSSCSNFRDFQARRCNIRFKQDKKSRPEFVHTLNGSGVAVPRLMIALLENFQQEDGSIVIPEALREYTGFDTIT